MKLFNSLSNEVEKFSPLDEKEVGMYTCGPTVYNYVSIGNWRTYMLGDILARTIKYKGYNLKYIMNITDVGHLTGDNEGDADQGDDRLEKAARERGKSAWEISRYYTEDFLKGFEKLNFIKPNKFVKATDHIQEQIDMVKKIENRGLTYEISDGIYFDTEKYEEKGYEYGVLSNLDEIKEGARVKKNPQKRNPRDFALWKFSPEDKKRQMEWDSPWGKGFPGWHIECSAMSCEYLGKQFDIHVGGEDLKSTHHPNEVAQAQAAYDRSPFVKYWVHGAFLQVDGGRMGKSLGNAYTLDDIKSKGFEYLALRYFYMTGHYKKKLNFTWESLEAASNALSKLYERVGNIKANISNYDMNTHNDYINRFDQALDDDLNLPKALGVLWDLIKSSINNEEKISTISLFDRVFGLRLLESGDEQKVTLSQQVKRLLKEREKARKEKNWNKADMIRDKLRDKFKIEILDTDDGFEIKTLS
jgi:cysteinyl-tRNA synthetase